MNTQDAWGRFKIWYWHRFRCDHCRYMRKYVKEQGRGD